MRLQIVKANIFWSFIAAISIACAAVSAEPWSALISPENSLEFGFLKNDAAVFRLSRAGLVCLRANR
jgi:hypothetical protein